MKYRVTLVETTRHVVVVEADNECTAQAEAVAGWRDGWLVDDRSQLLDLETVKIDAVPTEAK